MTTNDKEYMRNYQRERRAKLKSVKKSVKIVKKSVKNLENLHPPMIGEKTVVLSGTGSFKSYGADSSTALKPTDMDIDFTRIANLSTFQRFIIEAIKISVPGFKGVPTRGKKEIMAKEFNKRASNYRLVMTELKEKLKGLGKL